MSILAPLIYSWNRPESFKVEVHPRNIAAKMDENAFKSFRGDVLLLFRYDDWRRTTRDDGQFKGSETPIFA